MTKNSTSIPKWITIYLWVTFVITLGASLTAYLNPEALLANWEALPAAGALSLAGPLGLFVARNMATAAVTLFGLLQKNAYMIKIILLLRIISDGLDMMNNIVADSMQVAIMGGIMCLIEIFAFTKIKT